MKPAGPWAPLGRSQDRRAHRNMCAQAAHSLPSKKRKMEGCITQVMPRYRSKTLKMRGGILCQANRYLGGFCSSQRSFLPQTIQGLLIIVVASGQQAVASAMTKHVTEPALSPFASGDARPPVPCRSHSDQALIIWQLEKRITSE